MEHQRSIWALTTDAPNREKNASDSNKRNELEFWELVVFPPENP